MGTRAIHVSDAEAAHDLPSLLDRVRTGAEIIIEHDAKPVAILRPAEPPVRLLSESLRLARELGSTATLDAIICGNREPLDPPVWD